MQLTAQMQARVCVQTWLQRLCQCHSRGYSRPCLRLHAYAAPLAIAALEPRLTPSHPPLVVAPAPAPAFADTALPARIPPLATSCAYACLALPRRPQDSLSEHSCVAKVMKLSMRPPSCRLKLHDGTYEFKLETVLGLKPVS